MGRAAHMRSQLPPPPTAGGGPPQDLGRRLLTLPRGQDEELRLSLDAYEGHPFLNVRIWTRDADGRGWWPSKRGVTFKLRELADVAEALAEALDLLADYQAPRPPSPGPGLGRGPRRDRPASPALPPPARAGGEEFSAFSEFSES
jgi:Transcriptional Coactivator p15 (PC4)